MNSGLSRLGIALLAAMFAPALLAADLEKLDVAAFAWRPGRAKAAVRRARRRAAWLYHRAAGANRPRSAGGYRTSSAPKNRELSVGNYAQRHGGRGEGSPRLIINLTTLSSYTTRVEGSNLFVVVGNSPAGASVASTARSRLAGSGQLCPADQAQAVRAGGSCHSQHRFPAWRKGRGATWSSTCPTRP